MGGATSKVPNPISPLAKKVHPKSKSSEMNISSPEDAQSYFSKLVSDNPVVIFSATYCPYCKMGKAAVRSAGDKVDGFGGAKVVECDKIKGGREIRDAIRKAGGGSTVPSTWIGGEYVGGGEDMARLEKEGVLKQMIKLAVDHSKGNDLREGTGDSEMQRMVGGAATGASGKSGKNLESVLLGAGCFWGVELAFQRLEGVVSTQVGYAGGKSPQTNYKQVCTGTTGHAEVVKVTFDPTKISFEKILEVWEERHDPTSKDRQGNDRGTQYRSAIFYTNDAQKEKAMKWKEEKMKKGKKIVTEVAPVKNYVEAEKYHQQYLEKGGQSAEKGATSRIRCYG